MLIQIANSPNIHLFDPDSEHLTDCKQNSEEVIKNSNVGLITLREIHSS